MGDIISHSQDNKIFTLVNKQHTGIQHIGNQLKIQVFCKLHLYFGDICFSQATHRQTTHWGPTKDTSVLQATPIFW